MATMEPWNAEPMRPVKWISLTVPESRDIALKDGLIVWRVTSPLSYRRVAVPKGLLARFLRLAEQKESAFLRFAQKWGCLALCEHGLPATHYYSCSLSLHEPVEQWRIFSREAHAILRIRDYLNRGERAGPADWILAHGMSARLGWRWAANFLAFATPRASRVLGRNELSQCVQAWLDAADIRPRLTWSERENSYQISWEPSKPWYPNLFAHIAMELMLSVANVERLAICSGCGIPYPSSRKKRPAESRRSFCPDCGRKAAVRLAVRRFREKAKQNRNGESE